MSAVIKRFSMNCSCEQKSKAVVEDCESRDSEGVTDVSDMAIQIAVVSAAHQLSKSTRRRQGAEEELLGVPCIPNKEVSANKILAMKCMKAKRDSNCRRMAMSELSKWDGIMLNQTLKNYLKLKHIHQYTFWSSRQQHIYQRICWWEE